MKKSDKPANLTSAEAYKLFSSACSGAPYKGRIIGNEFRKSCKYFEEVGSEFGWTPPPIDLHLPIDNIIENLIVRNNAPMILKRDTEVNFGLKYYGPFELVRSHLVHFATWHQRNPIDGELRNLNLKTMLDDIMKAKHPLEALVSRGLIGFLGIPSRSFDQVSASREDKDIYWQVFCDRATTALDRFKHTVKDLELLEYMIRLDLEISNQNKQATGRPRETWKAEFVSYLAHLWKILTKDEASKNPNSWFGEFVAAAWRSYDENMPEVSFDRAIRDRVLA